MERRIEIDGERWDDVAEEGKMGTGIAGKLRLPCYSECRGSPANYSLIWLIVEARQVSACSDDDGSRRVNEGLHEGDERKLENAAFLMKTRRRKKQL